MPRTLGFASEGVRGVVVLRGTRGRDPPGGTTSDATRRSGVTVTPTRSRPSTTTAIDARQPADPTHTSLRDSNSAAGAASTSGGNRHTSQPATGAPSSIHATGSRVGTHP